MKERQTKQHYTWSQDKDRREIAQQLKGGHVLAGTSDTVLGLLALADERGFQALNRIKLRNDKPYIVLLPDQKELNHYGHLPLPDVVSALADAFWPGPLTLIVRARKDLPEWLAAGGTLAVRVPAHEGLLALMRQTGPLFSTSANLTGQPIPATSADLDPRIIGQVAGIIDDNVVSQGNTLPSTLVDCMGSEPRIIREGAISRDMITTNFLREKC